MLLRARHAAAIRAAVAVGLLAAAALLTTSGRRARDQGRSALLAADRVGFFGPVIRSRRGEARLPVLTVPPDVAEWMYAHGDESGDQDGALGTDSGWGLVPAAHQDSVRESNGRVQDLRQSRRASLRATRRMQELRQMSGRDEAAGGVRMQELGEVTDFPDIDEYLPTKEAAQQVKDIYDEFEPAEEQIARQGPEEVRDYADFYRAYAAYQLPAARSVGGPMQPTLPNLGDQLPPNLYPYSPAYYPAGGAKRVAVTINANGAGSQNSFNVQGPALMSVKLGGGGAGEGETGGGGDFTYPDGHTAVGAAPSQSGVSYQEGGMSSVEGHDDAFQAAGANRETWDKEAQTEGLGGDFLQDAYDDAEW